jgi:FkbM family methyltransferase
MSKSSITLKNAVLKTDENLFRKGVKTIRDSGLLVFVAKTFGVIFLLLKRFFREYLPLKIMYLLSKNGEIVKTVQGNRMILNLNDLGISRELALYGVHERNSTAYVKKIITPGMRILEVGANIGYYAMIESRLAGESGHLYAFEPSPFNIDLLRRNLELNNFRNYDIYPNAVGGKRGRAKFYVDSRSNLSGFIKREGAEYAGVVDVEMVTLDDFLKDKKVDFIRMDVEGYEREILKGAENAFRSGILPKYFFIEVHSELLHKKSSSAEEIIRFMKGFGYEAVKSFYRGGSKIVANSTEELLNHPYLEKGYWETFFRLK